MLRLCLNASGGTFSVTAGMLLRVHVFFLKYITKDLRVSQFYVCREFKEARAPPEAVMSSVLKKRPEVPGTVAKCRRIKMTKKCSRL